DRPPRAPPPRQIPPDATTARAAHARSAARLRPRGTAWAPRRPGASRSPPPGPRPRSWRRLRGRRFLRLDHPVEGLARLDHAQLVARALFHGRLARLEVLDFGGQRIVALLQPGVVARLLPHLGPELRHFALPAAAEPQPVLQPAQQYQQQQQDDPQAAHRSWAPSALQRDESIAAGVAGGAAQRFLDTQQLVVLGDAIAAAQRAGLDLGGGGRHRDVGDGHILGLAGTVRHHRGITRRVGHRDRFQRFGQRTDLVDLDQDRVAHAAFDAVAEDARVGHEQVVADQLDPVAQALGQQLPAVPVALVHAVLDGDDRVLRGPIGEEVDELLAGQALALAGEVVLAVVEELAGGDVQAQHHVLARVITGLADRLEDRLQRFLVAAQVRREAALVADRGRQASALEHRLQRVERLGARAQRLGE